MFYYSALNYLPSFLLLRKNSATNHTTPSGLTVPGCRPALQTLHTETGREGMARLAAIQAPYPGSKQIACKNSNQSIAQPSKHTDAFFSCNCSCWQLSNFVIRDKAGNTLYSKCTSIKGIPCISPTLTQPLRQDGTCQNSRSQQERRFHPAVWVPRAAVPRSPHPT